MPNAADSSIPRWLHCWALLTVAATVVLLPLGALVTTIRAGMADPVWPTTPWYLAVTPWQGLSVGFLIEHSHRFAGYFVGCCAIVLAVGSWWCGPRWLAWLGIVSLLAVIAQGLLGGFRVRLERPARSGDGRGPRRLRRAGVQPAGQRRRVDRPTVERTARGRGTTAASGAADAAGGRGRVGQLALGAVLRHTDQSVGPRLHLLGAFAVLAAATWLARAVWDSPTARKRLGRSVSVLVLFVAVQLMLGVEAWLSKYAQGFIPVQYLERPPVLPWPQVVVRTAHFLLGSCILAAAAATTLLARLSASPIPAADCSSPPCSAATIDRATTAASTGRDSMKMAVSASVEGDPREQIGRQRLRGRLAKAWHCSVPRITLSSPSRASRCWCW